MEDKERLDVYDRVNRCENLSELSTVILDLRDEDGMIQGRARRFSAINMARFCEQFEQECNPNVLTREFGIRQQAMYITRLNYFNKNN